MAWKVIHVKRPPKSIRNVDLAPGDLIAFMRIAPRVMFMGMVIESRRVLPLAPDITQEMSLDCTGFEPEDFRFRLTVIWIQDDRPALANLRTYWSRVIVPKTGMKENDIPYTNGSIFADRIFHPVFVGGIEYELPSWDAFERIETFK